MAGAVRTTAPSPNMITATWSSLTGTEVGDAATISRWQDRTVQAVGAFTSVTMQGSNDGSNYFTLTDPQGVDIILTAAGGCIIAENPVYIRPSAVGGGAEFAVIVAGSQS